MDKRNANISQNIFFCFPLDLNIIMSIMLQMVILRTETFFGEPKMILLCNYNYKTPFWTLLANIGFSHMHGFDYVSRKEKSFQSWNELYWKIFLQSKMSWSIMHETNIYGTFTVFTVLRKSRLFFHFLTAPFWSSSFSAVIYSELRH